MDSVATSEETNVNESQVGLELVPRDYDMDTASPFRRTDIISMIPVYKERHPNQFWSCKREVSDTSSCEEPLAGDALYAFRRALKDPGNVLQSWDPTLVNPCTWFHVTCDGITESRGLILEMQGCLVTGTLVPELGRLEKLQYLELYRNNLMGRIPKELGGLKSLLSLDLYHNNLTGTIPPSLSRLTSLRFLLIDGFTKELPKWALQCSGNSHLFPHISGLKTSWVGFFKFGETFHRQRKLAVLGSRPPMCVNKCFTCRPCMATLVIPPHRSTSIVLSKEEKDESYYLLSWECRCGDKHRKTIDLYSLFPEMKRGMM